MSAEHRLEGGAGLYGKHPAFGDFISAGLGERWRVVADWAEVALGGWREAAGPDWQAAIDQYSRGRLSPTMARRSPRLKPSCARPQAIARTFSATCDQL